MPAAVKPRRRTRYDTPAWAEGILGDNPTPADFDRLEAHHQARALPSDTDPDTIDDPDVRDAFIDQAQRAYNRQRDVEDHGVSDDGPSTGGARDARGARDGTDPSSAPPASLRRAFGRDAGGMFSRVDTDDASGLLLGALLYGIAVAALRDPSSAPNGVKAWFRAKFFNQTTGGAAPQLVATAASAPDPALVRLLAPTASSTSTPATTWSTILSPTPAPTMPAPAGVLR